MIYTSQILKYAKEASFITLSGFQSLKSGGGGRRGGGEGC